MRIVATEYVSLDGEFEDFGPGKWTGCVNREQAPLTAGAGVMQTDANHSPNPSQLISDKIASLGDWRGQTLARLRDLIHEVDPDIVEEWKWGTAVWTHDGLVCSAGAFKDHVKLNFFKGASLEDPRGLFNAGLDAKATRAVDIAETGLVDESALMDLLRAAVTYNVSSATRS